MDTKKVFHKSAVVAGSEGVGEPGVCLIKLVASFKGIGQIVVPDGIDGVAGGVDALEKGRSEVAAAVGHFFDDLGALSGSGFDNGSMIAGREEVVFAVQNGIFAVDFVGMETDLVDSEVPFTGIRETGVFENFQGLFYTDSLDEFSGRQKSDCLVRAKNLFKFQDFACGGGCHLRLLGRFTFEVEAKGQGDGEDCQGYDCQMDFFKLFCHFNI